jgi:hypothetical protein
VSDAPDLYVFINCISLISDLVNPDIEVSSTISACVGVVGGQDPHITPSQLQLLAITLITDDATKRKKALDKDQTV